MADSAKGMDGVGNVAAIYLNFLMAKYLLDNLRYSYDQNKLS